MSRIVQIYVALIDEGVPVWRPVMAKMLGGETYLIVDKSYDREAEIWQFEPGVKVVCQEVSTEDGPILVAIRRAKDS